MTGDAMHASGPWPDGEDPMRRDYYDDPDAPVPNALVVATSAVVSRSRDVRRVLLG